MKRRDLEMLLRKEKSDMADAVVQEREQEGISREQLQELERILNHFINAYDEKAQGQTDGEWLRDRLLAEVPELNQDTAAACSQDVLAAIQAYDKTLQSLTEARKHGKTTAEWFFRRTRQDCSAITESEYASRMLAIHTSMEQITQVKSADSKMLAQIAKDLDSTETNASYTQLLAEMVGEQVELAGLQSVVRLSEYVQQVESPGEESAAVIRALEKGETAGLKIAVAGALTTASSRQVIRIVSIEQSMPETIEHCANLAGMTVENARTSAQLAQKKITPGEAADQKAANIAAFTTRMIVRTVGRTLSHTALLIPIFGPVLNTIGCEVTGWVEKKASKKVADAVVKVRRPIADAAKKMKAAVKDGIKTGINKVKEHSKALRECFRITDMV